MRAWAAVACAILLAGCLGPSEPPTPAPAGDGDARTARPGDRGAEGGDFRIDGRTETVLAELAGGTTLPGTYPVEMHLGTGGARDVTWHLQLQGTTAPNLDGLHGHGCVWGGWGPSANTFIVGTCEDLPEGDVELDLVFSVPVLAFKLTVNGFVKANATEP